MKSFNVIWWDFNKSKPEAYDIMPYLTKCYNESKKKPETFEEFKEFIRNESLYMWWSRCQYEVIIKKWPSLDESYKLDIHAQVMMNIDIITKIFMDGNK